MYIYIYIHTCIYIYVCVCYTKVATKTLKNYGPIGALYIQDQSGQTLERPCEPSTSAAGGRGPDELRHTVPSYGRVSMPCPQNFRKNMGKMGIQWVGLKGNFAGNPWNLCPKYGGVLQGFPEPNLGGRFYIT